MSTFGMTMELIDAYDKKYSGATIDVSSFTDDMDSSEGDTDPFATKKSKISLADMDYVSWRRDLEADFERLDLLLLMLKDITPEHDSKLQMLIGI